MTSIQGHSAPIAELLAAAQGPRFHHAWLFTGPEGVGKAMVAKAAAARMLAESAGPAPRGYGLTHDSEHRIVRLIEAGAHSDLIWLQRTLNEKTDKRARNISVDQVRAMSARFSLAPAHSERRIVVIDAIDDLEKGAANALLKSLEEPPKHTVFFLISQMPGRLLPTIRSRCRVLRFAPLAVEDMRTVLREQLPEAGADEITALIAAAEGSPGKALALAGLDIAGIDTALNAIARTGDPSNAARTALASQLSLKVALPRYEVFLKRAPSFVAAQARTRQGPALRAALDAYAEAQTIAATAPIHNLDPQSAVFEICGLVATLAPR